MERHNFGRVITMSPPIIHDFESFSGKTAYFMSKLGMTMVALGAAAEGQGKNITGNSLWPATVIESLASINFQLGDRSTWRKASILADCVVSIASEPESFTGNMLIDDTYLRSKGMSEEELREYNCDPDAEPPRILAMDGQETWVGEDFKRGDIRQLDQDLERSTNPTSKL